MAAEAKVENLSQMPRAVSWFVAILQKGLEGGPVAVSIDRYEEKRTADQNDKFHPLIREIQRQHKHSTLVTEKHWREFLVAQCLGQMMVPSLDGQQLIVVNKRGSSELKKAEGVAFIEYLYSVGADLGIKWSEPSIQTFNQYREAEK